MLDNSVKVSVIIPNYNHASYLARRIESVLNQTYSNLEIILMDDCSPDNSTEIITHYSAQDSRIQVVLNEQNSGNTFRQWNKGIALATGKYVWIAESDDAADLTLVEKLIEPLEADDKVVLSYCDSYHIDERDEVLGTWQWFMLKFDSDLFAHDFVLDGKTLVQRFMSYRNIIPNASAVLVRRSTLSEIGPAKDNMKVCGDWLYWAHILSKGKAAFTTQTLNYFRSHPNNVRSRNQINGTAIMESAQILSAMQIYGPADPTAVEKAVSHLLELWFHSSVYNEIPWQRHVAIYNAFRNASPNFPQRFRRELRHYMFRNRLSGVRMMLGDGLVYKLLQKYRKSA